MVSVCTGPQSRSTTIYYALLYTTVLCAVGVEPWSFYFVNGFLNFNVVFILALLAIPLIEFRVKQFGLPSIIIYFIPHCRSGSL